MEEALSPLDNDTCELARLLTIPGYERALPAALAPDVPNVAHLDTLSDANVRATLLPLLKTSLAAFLALQSRAHRDALAALERGDTEALWILLLSYLNGDDAAAPRSPFLAYAAAYDMALLPVANPRDPRAALDSMALCSVRQVTTQVACMRAFYFLHGLRRLVGLVPGVHGVSWKARLALTEKLVHAANRIATTFDAVVELDNGMADDATRGMYARCGLGFRVLCGLAHACLTAKESAHGLGDDLAAWRNAQRHALCAVVMYATDPLGRLMRSPFFGGHESACAKLRGDTHVELPTARPDTDAAAMIKVARQRAAKVSATELFFVLSTV